MFRAYVALALLTWTLWGAVSAGAQTTEAATRARLDTLLTATSGTPDGQGLLPTAIAEARAVVDQAVRAERADDLATIHQAAGEILTALDPSLPRAGTTWYGIRRAVQAIAVEGAALAGDRAADAQRTAPRVADAVRNVLAWSDALAAVARQVREARDVAEARTLTPGLRRLAQQLLQGRDADGDGRVTFAAGEPGLQLLQVSVRTRAGTPPPRVGPSSPALSTEVVR